jgi:hypothetical protein
VERRPRTKLSSEEAAHEFPSHHTDFLEQFIDHKVPIEMFSKLTEQDGSVKVDRIKGEFTFYSTARKNSRTFILNGDTDGKGS